MLAVLAVIVILASFSLVLGIIAICKLNHRWFQVHTKVWRVATFSMEMGQEKAPPGEAAGCTSGELESGEDR